MSPPSVAIGIGRRFGNSLSLSTFSFRQGQLRSELSEGNRPENRFLLSSRALEQENSARSQKKGR